MKLTNGQNMKNKCYNTDCLEFMPTIPDKFFHFIFIDPPYFRVKGDFDFKLSFHQWQQLHKTLAKECNRILADNGSIILWGHAKKIAYQQIEFDKYFNLLNSCVWEKNNTQTKKNSPELQRSFIPVSERFLFYDKGEDKSGLTMIHSNPDLFGSIKEYMRQEKTKIKKDYGFKTEKQFNDFINEATDTKSIVSRHYFADSQYCFPTKEIYNKLQKIKSGGYFKKEYEYFKKEYEYFKKEYEDLRLEYEKLRRYFNLTDALKNDIIHWDQEDHKTRELKHPTCKPPGLVAELVKICCGPDTKIFEPFTGTETLRKIAWSIGLYYEGCELDPIHWKGQEERFKKHTEHPELFESETIQECIYNQGVLL